MARPRRLAAPDLTYHLMARGNARGTVFADAADSRRFLAHLARVVGERSWSVQSYCLMPNHLHLLVRTPAPDVSDGMRDLLSGHALSFNQRHGRVGHVFQGRFLGLIVKEEAHHLELFRYLALNPVRARLRAHPEEYRWSAHAALMGLVEPPRLLDAALEPFSGDRHRYGAFVADGSNSYLTDLIGDGARERLRIAIAAGFSHREIAEALGVGKSTVARRLERAEAPDPFDPGQKRLTPLARARSA